MARLGLHMTILNCSEQQENNKGKSEEEEVGGNCYSFVKTIVFPTEKVYCFKEKNSE